jgi:hypothetical protein
MVLVEVGKVDLFLDDSISYLINTCHFIALFSPSFKCNSQSPSLFNFFVVFSLFVFSSFRFSNYHSFLFCSSHHHILYYIHSYVTFSTFFFKKLVHWTGLMPSCNRLSIPCNNANDSNSLFKTTEQQQKQWRS